MTIVSVNVSHYDAGKLIVFESTNMLTGLNVCVHMITLRMKRVRAFSFDPPVSPLIDVHKVIKVEISNGESYALDIAGAKFGLFKAMVPWSEYVRDHVRGTLSSENIILA